MSQINKIDKVKEKIKKLKEKNKEKKITKTNPNTLKTRKNSLDNFEAYFEEEFKEPSKDILAQIIKEEGKDGVITLLQAWIYWNSDRGLVPRTIRAMASEVKKQIPKKIEIEKDDLEYGKVIKEARGIMTSDMMEHFINHCDKKRKARRVKR